jgi:hypothetical protein
VDGITNAAQLGFFGSITNAAQPGVGDTVN